MRSTAPRVAALLTVVVLFLVHQAPKMATKLVPSDEQVATLRDSTSPPVAFSPEMTPRRARARRRRGRLLYASDLPGLDLIGLGAAITICPFARAGRARLGATLELIGTRRAPRSPRFFAIYPLGGAIYRIGSGERLLEVPVHGNVICGGSEKVINLADWHALDRSERRTPSNQESKSSTSSTWPTS